MKIINFISIFIVSIVFSGCNTACGCTEWIHSPFGASHIVQNNNKLYFEVFAINVNNNKDFFVDSNKSYLFEFNDTNKTWARIAFKNNSNIALLDKDHNKSYVQKVYDILSMQKHATMINQKEFVMFENNTLIIKDIKNNKTIQTQNLPTGDEIAQSLALEIINGIDRVLYAPFFTKQNEWDRKSFIVMIATNKNEKSEAYTLYYIYMKKDGSNWGFQKVAKRLNEYAQFLDSSSNAFVSIDARFTSAFREYFVKQNNEVRFMRDFMDMYDSSFEEIIYRMDIFQPKSSMLSKITNILTFKDECPTRIFFSGDYGVFTFDEKKNMHFFYQEKDDILNKNFDYFWYSYYEKDDSTKPKYKQRLLWK